MHHLLALVVALAAVQTPTDVPSSDADAPPAAAPSAAQPSVDAAAAPSDDEKPAAVESAPASADDASTSPSMTSAESAAESATVDDDAFDTALDACVALLETGDARGARACLDVLAQTYPTRERDIARVRRLVDAAAPEAPAEPAPATTEAVAEPAPVGGDVGELVLPAFLKPGRLEFSAVTGIYGVWAGVTSGLLLGFNSDQYLWNLDPSIIILATGGAGVGLGLAGLAAGYAVADQLDVDQGHAWSYTAGMTWGTSYAISLLPVLWDFQSVPWWLTDEVNAGVPLLGGGIGAASAFGLSLVVDPDIAEVSMMNTGGWTAGLTGLLVGFNTVMWTEPAAYQPTTMAVSYVVGKSLGLGLGLAASQVIGYTWGETLLGDVGVILGALLFGSGAFAFVASPFSEPMLTALLGGKDDVLFSKLTLTFVSGSAIGGGVLGLLTTTAGLYAFHRFSGVPFIKEDLPFVVRPMTMGFVADRYGRPSPAMTLVDLSF